MERHRLSTILTLGLPIIGGMISQSILNLVDIAMVGVLGKEALAGVGVGSFANFMAVSLVMGLSSGVQSMVARRRGEGNVEHCAMPLNGGLLLAIAIALPLTVFFLFTAELVISLMNQTDSIIAIGTPYFQWRILAILAIGLNFSFRGYWNGINRAMVYLRTLLIMHLCNVVISYGLIFGCFGLPEYGPTGAGMGTTISLYIGTFVYALLTYREGRQHGYLQGLPNAQTMKTMLRLSIPNSLQQFFFASGFAVFIAIIGLISAEATAVANVLIQLALFLILPGVGLGMAATTLVSESLGRGHKEEAYRWGWDVVKVAVVILFILGTPMWLFPDFILSIFSLDTELIELGRLPLQIMGIGICLDAVGIVLTQALLGAGANRSVMMISISTQWFFFLPLVWIVGPYLGYGLLGIWILQMIHRIISSSIFSVLWGRREWSHIRI